jgi:hypothetical protein
MADININDLLGRKILGNDLFSDSESFMMELSDESECIIGGKWQPQCYTGANGDAATYPCVQTDDDYFY